jgi:hypothetical protein
MHLGNQSICLRLWTPNFRSNLLFSTQVSLLLHAILADVDARLFSSEIWLNHLDTIMDWASYVLGLILHHPVVMCVDIQEPDT